MAGALCSSSWRQSGSQTHYPPPLIPVVRLSGAGLAPKQPFFEPGFFLQHLPPSPRLNPILSSVMHCSSVKYQLTHSIHPNNDLRKKCRKNRDTCTFSGSWSRSVIGRREQVLRAYCCLRAICRLRRGRERERSIVTAISIMSRHIVHRHKSLPVNIAVAMVK